MSMTGRLVAASKVTSAVTDDGVVIVVPLKTVCCCVAPLMSVASVVAATMLPAVSEENCVHDPAVATRFSEKVAEP